jgi:hypothetical protein
VIPIQLTKAVVENGSDVGPFSHLPIHLCALCDLCGIPPHPDPKGFSDGLELEVVRKPNWAFTKDLRGWMGRTGRGEGR